MKKESKMLQLQIRVTSAEKTAIQRAAKQAQMGMSQWVLIKVLGSGQTQFQQLLDELRKTKNKSTVLAEIHDLFKTATPHEFEQIVSHPPLLNLSDYWKNYITAMIEHTANQKALQPPAWTKNIKALEKPVFGSELMSLRLYLLTHSLLAFRQRNIFIDSSVGDRV